MLNRRNTERRYWLDFYSINNSPGTNQTMQQVYLRTKSQDLAALGSFHLNYFSPIQSAPPETEAWWSSSCQKRQLWSVQSPYMAVWQRIFKVPPALSSVAFNSFTAPFWFPGRRSARAVVTGDNIFCSGWLKMAPQAHLISQKGLLNKISPSSSAKVLRNSCSGCVGSFSLY